MSAHSCAYVTGGWGPAALTRGFVATLSMFPQHFPYKKAVMRALMGLPALDLLYPLSCILTPTSHTLPTTSIARIKRSHTHQGAVNSLMLGW